MYVFIKCLLVILADNDSISRRGSGSRWYHYRGVPNLCQDNWVEIKTSLLNGAYKPCPVKRVEIPKDNGGTGNLGIPVVMDRVIQSQKLSGISQILTPVFDPYFSEFSFGFRANRSAHQAVRNVLKLIQKGYAYAVDIDSRMLSGLGCLHGVPVLEDSHLSSGMDELLRHRSEVQRCS